MLHARRELLRLLGFAPVATSNAGRQLQRLLTDPAFAILSAQTVELNEKVKDSYAKEEPQESVAEKVFGRRRARFLGRLHQQAREQRFLRQNLRQTGLDADIASLKSCSRVYLEAKQLERDMHLLDQEDDFAFKLWG